MDITEQKTTRKIRAPERYRPDGTYYTGPKDPKTYYNNYYHTKGAKEEACQYCGKSVKNPICIDACTPKLARLIG